MHGSLGPCGYADFAIHDPGFRFLFCGGVRLLETGGTGALQELERLWTHGLTALVWETSWREGKRFIHSVMFETQDDS